MKIEWMMLADSAQVVNNKVYILGGGWERLSVSTDFPTRRRCALALAFSVPWEETNQEHTFSVRIVDEDGQEVHGKINGKFESGRPVGMPAGTEQRVQLAIDLNLSIPHEGTYVIETTLEDGETSRTTFSVRKAS